MLIPLSLPCYTQMLELTQKSERTIQGLELKVASLSREAASHHDGVEELNREHKIQVDSLREEKAMLEVSVERERKGDGGVLRFNFTGEVLSTN